MDLFILIFIIIFIIFMIYLYKITNKKINESNPHEVQKTTVSLKPVAYKYPEMIEKIWATININDINKIKNENIQPKNFKISSQNTVSWDEVNSSEYYIIQWQKINDDNVWSEAETKECFYTLNELEPKTSYRIRLKTVDSNKNQSSPIDIFITTS